MRARAAGHRLRRRPDRRLSHRDRGDVREHPALVEEAGLSFLHVFPFSPRPGTPAARMPPVARAVVKARAARLRAAGDAALARHLDARSAAASRRWWSAPGLARAEDFTEIAFDGAAAAGRDRPLAVTGHDGRRARWELGA